MTAGRRMRIQANQKTIIAVITVLLWFSQYVYMPYQTTYLLLIGVSSSLLGIIVGAYGIPQIILRFPVGILADRKARHKLFIILGCATSGLASVFRLFIPDATGFLIGSLLSGLASSVWVSFLVLYPSYFKREEAKKASGQIFAANNLGILAGFIVATVSYDYYGMPFLCTTSIAASLGACILSLFICETEQKKEVLQVRRLIRAVKDKQLILFSILMLVQQGTVMSTATSFTTQVAKGLAGHESQIGICAVVYIVSACLSSMGTGRRFTESMGGSKVFVPCIMFGLFLYNLLVPNAPSIYMLFLIQILAGFSQGMLQSYCAAEAVANVPAENKSTAMGFYMSVYSTGMLTFPVLMGLLVETLDIKNAFYYMSLFSLGAFVVALIHYVLLKRKSRERKPCDDEEKLVRTAR